MSEDAAEPAGERREVAVGAGGDLEAGGEGARGVEQRGRTVDGVENVVDGAALLHRAVVAMRYTEVEPFTGFHLGACLAVALELEHCTERVREVLGKSSGGLA